MKKKKKELPRCEEGRKKKEKKKKELPRCEEGRKKKKKKWKKNLKSSYGGVSEEWRKKKERKRKEKKDESGVSGKVGM